MAKAQSYQLVTSTEGLVDGGKYLIVSNSKALGTTQNTNNRAAVNITFDNGNISNVPADACVLELQAQDGGTWAFYDALKEGYLYEGKLYNTPRYINSIYYFTSVVFNNLSLSKLNLYSKY